jgi:glycosyltransferase involved in cell wall biosynthesis
MVGALAGGVAVVATDVGSIHEVVTAEKDGLLVAPEDPVALAGAIERLLSDEPLRRRLAEAGYRTVEERYSLDAQVRRIEAVYDEELARAGVLVPAATSRRTTSRRGPQERGALEMPPGG